MHDPVKHGPAATGLAHRSQEQLELYALDRLTDTQVMETEEHLLICQPCRSQLDEVAAFAFAMRDVLVQHEEPETQAGISGWFDRLRYAARNAVGGNVFAWKPQTAFAGAFAAILLAVGVYAGLAHLPGHSKLSLPVANLELSAMRGDVPVVRVARELDLTLLGTPPGNGPGDELRVEILTETGSSVWAGKPLGQNPPGSLHVKVAAPLEPGMYLARLYHSPKTLVHEYGFRVTE